ncbi:MAG: hypothetical protein AAFP98_08290 [Pseudomonadota bacterium]
MYKLLTFVFLTSVLLAACSSGSSDEVGTGVQMPTPGGGGAGDPMVEEDGAVRNSNGTVTVTAGTTTLDLPVENSDSTDGLPRWFDGSVNADGFETDAVLAIGGIQDGTFFSAVSGDFASAPVGSLTYQGRYEINTSTVGVGSPLTIEYDASQSTITALDGDFEVSGDVTNAGVATGTVTFEGVSTDFNGGFFGPDADVVGVFHSNSFAGIFYGDETAGP